MSAPKVILLPGAVLPADLAYADLTAVLGDAAEVAVKDLEVYRQTFPPPGYSLDTEVEGVLGEADARGWQRFHLVGYSGGGAAALACAANHPGRLLSLGMLEPAWAGSWNWSPRHERLWADYEELSQLPHDQFMAAFMRLQVRPGVPLPAPPPGPPPPWMQQRPDGIRALMGAFHTYGLDREALTAFDRPVYFALGGLSNPDQFAEIAERLRTIFADFTLEVFPERHHFDPPHRAEPARLAQSLMAIWSRGDQMTGPSEF